MCHQLRAILPQLIPEYYTCVSDALKQTAQRLAEPLSADEEYEEWECEDMDVDSPPDPHVQPQIPTQEARSTRRGPIGGAASTRTARPKGAAAKHSNIPTPGRLPPRGSAITEDATGLGAPSIPSHALLQHPYLPMFLARFIQKPPFNSTFTPFQSCLHPPQSFLHCCQQFIQQLPVMSLHF
jgi:hypothetical protein